jgi:nitrogen PTS system EIIA component
MDLSVREAARLLAVPEETVHRWIREGSLPASRVRREYRLNRTELQEWAAVHRQPVSPELFVTSGPDALSLAQAFELGGVHRDVVGTSREEILQSATELPGIPDGVDRSMLFDLLMARESLGSTSVGRGIALPHPRDPLVLRITEPRVLLCLPRERVDFGAPDGVPVRALFLLLSPSVRVHLRLLARLAYALHDEMFEELLGRAAPSEAMIQRLRELEKAGGAP